MPTIKTQLTIHAPIQHCFDLARSIDLHQVSTAQSREYVIAGRQTGLIQLGEAVTWRAKHFGIWQNLTAQITALDAPYYFCDEMVKGAFKRFKHEHFFEAIAPKQTLMQDHFDFESPFGLIGQVFNQLVLTSYMQEFLESRNQVIKHYAETEKWKEILSRKTV